jgi:hypothetical protein
MKTDKILERIRKLLNMAADTSSPNEAAIAAGRARKLMDQYQVTDWDLKQNKEEDFGSARTIWEDTWHGMLGIAMAWLNDVNCRQQHGDGFLDTPHLLFEGYLVDAVTAKELWLYLVAQAEIQSKQVRGRKEPFKRGFASGVQAQVKEILKEREKIVTSNGTALVVCKRQLVESRYGQMKTSQVRRSTGGNFQAGYERGLKAGLNRQVSGSSSRKQLT